MKAVPRVTRELLEKYATSAPRYTSYPTAIDWTSEFAPETYPELLAGVADADTPLSVYVHIPYCAKLCLFCGCNVQITNSDERVERYLEALERELETIAASGIGGRPVGQYHWGGGTPTHLSPKQIERLQRAVLKTFHMAPDAEVAIEVDPRVTTPEQIDVLASLGFNRVSMGLQDFDSKVQEHVHRVQSEKDTRTIVDAARGAGIDSVNVDLMYGLPYQTLDGFDKTIASVLDMRPERVALFHYAHVPWMKKHQEALDVDAIPSTEDKTDIFLRALERFQGAGYVYIGLDHFALPDEELAVAAREERLHRNFMGYTTQRGTDMVSLGVSSIGHVDDCFVQNNPAEPEYKRLIAERGFATKRGHHTSADDKLRRDVILSLMCNGVTMKKAIEDRHGVDFDATFARELKELEGLEADGLVRCEADAIRLTPLGQVFMRNVALPFDVYFRARKARGQDAKNTFSKTL